MWGCVTEAEAVGVTVEGRPECREEMEAEGGFSEPETDTCDDSRFKAIVEVGCGEGNMETSQPNGGDGEGGAVSVAGSSEDDGEAVAEGVSGVQGSESAKETRITIPGKTIVQNNNRSQPR